jgi:hypothetical protein
MRTEIQTNDKWLIIVLTSLFAKRFVTLIARGISHLNLLSRRDISKSQRVKYSTSSQKHPTREMLVFASGAAFMQRFFTF